MNKPARKTASLPLQKSRRVIQLDQSQFALYRTGRLDILSPTGELLDYVGDHKKLIAAQENNEKLYNQLSLVEDIMVSSTGELHLSPRAIEGLASLMAQSREFIE
jgi:hypothetical protein